VVEGLAGLVITDPHLEQVTQHKDGVGIGCLQVPSEGLESERQGRAQVQV
jgi:hypothetical protein